MQYRFAIIPIVSIAADLLLSTFATASEIPAVSTGGDNAAGISAAILLSALTLYALYVATRPVIATGKGSIKWPLLFLSVLFILKTVGVALCPGFSVDVGTYEAWALEMARVGPAAMYRPGFFIDYPPGYLYALWR